MVTLLQFHQDLWHQKLSSLDYRAASVCVMIRLAVLIEHRLESDGQTEGQIATAYTALASRRAVQMYTVHGPQLEGSNLFLSVTS